LIDRLTFFADKSHGIRLELEHVKFTLHREDCFFFVFDTN